MSKFVVYNCTGYPGGGLADRFKGLVSCYALAKQLNREFIINWTYPHLLSEALIPNITNWLPRPIQGSYSKHRIFDAEGHTSYKTILTNKFSGIDEDILIIETNVNFLNDINSPQLFNELFNELFTCKLPLPKYIKTLLLGVAARFGGNQANWNDPNFNREVSYQEVYSSILRYKSENESIFLCSDSTGFLNFCKEQNLEFHTTENQPEHIDYTGCSLQGFKKAIEDFFILRECNPILSLKGNFAIIAALSNNKKLIEI